MDGHASWVEQKPSKTHDWPQHLLKKWRKHHWKGRINPFSLFLSLSFPLYASLCISALLLLLLFSKSAWHEWKQLKPEERQSKTWQKDFFLTRGGVRDRKGGVHEKGGERNYRFSFFPHPAMSMQNHPPRCFLTPKVAANMRKSASPAANCSLRRLDEEPPTPTPPHLIWDKEDVGKEILQTIHSIPLGRVARLFKESRYSAREGEHLWEAILEKRKKNLAMVAN